MVYEGKSGVGEGEDGRPKGMNRWLAGSRSTAVNKGASTVGDGALMCRPAQRSVDRVCGSSRSWREQVQAATFSFLVEHVVMRTLAGRAGWQTGRGGRHLEH